MSGIIYERFLVITRVLICRDTELLGFATDLYDSAIIKMIREGKPIPLTPFLSRGSQLDSLRYTIVKCLFGADKRVVSQAETWGLKFMAVSDLNGSTVHQLLRVVLIKGTLWRIILE